MVDPTKRGGYNGLVMRYRDLFGKTLRGVPQDVKSQGLAMLLRAGYVRNLGHGLYTYLPLGLKVAGKIKEIMKDELDRAGGQEVAVPLVNPGEIWKRSGREELIREDMIRFTDRSGRGYVLSPSHEEAFVELARQGLKSYRDFPALLYQFQRKFRDEERVRHGLMRLKEFEMKDAYSFHRSASDLNNFFPKMFAAYERIFRRCGLDVLTAESGVGYMGGEKAYEFLLPHQLGDDVVINCSSCGYRANRQVGRGGKQFGKGIPRPMERISTPGVQTMEELSAFLDLDKSRLMKSMVYRTGDGPVMAVVRGDYDVSEEKLSAYLGRPLFGFAGPGELASLGLVPGYLSPLGLQSGIPVIVDDTVAASVNLVAGGGEPDLHVGNCNFGRDFESSHVTDITTARAGDRCLQCGASLEYIQAIELGNIFKLGDYYSRRMGLYFQDEHGRSLHPHMGSYGIGIDRLIGALAEIHRDERGLRWPGAIAPYRFFLMGIGKSESVRREVEGLYNALKRDALIDDRKESPGVKFKDAELMGIPWRIVISSSTLEEGMVELFDRREMKKRLVPRADIRGVLHRLKEDVS